MINTNIDKSKNIEICKKAGGGYFQIIYVATPPPGAAA